LVSKLNRFVITMFIAVIIIGMSSVPIFSSSETLENNGTDREEKTFPMTTSGEDVEIEFSKSGGTDHISYDLNGFNTYSVNIEDQEHTHIYLEGESNLLKKGYPELPVISRSMIIPDDKEMEVRVTDKDYIEYDSVSIAPSKGSLSRSDNPNPSEVPYEFGRIYETDGWYPLDEEIVRMRDPHIIRDFRGQVVDFTPFQYHPTEERLRVYTDFEIEVFPDGRGGENILRRSGPLDTIPRDFARIYERRFINYEETLDRLRYDPVEEDGDMLVISYDGFSSEMTDFVDHKNSIGVPTEMVELSDIGSTADDVSDYIEDYYYEEDLTYVLLVGDNDHVPSPIVNVGGVDPGDHLSDPSYSFIEGDDYYPDIFVGRFSASEPSHVTTQVERSIYFEQNPDMDGEWRGNAMGLACDEGPGYEDMMDYEFMDYIRDRLMDYGDYTHVDRFYDSGYGELPGDPDPSHVSDGIEDGRHLINYVGHGLTDLIATSGFNTGHMEDLENEHLPFFITVACLTGNHGASTDPCFGEQWVRVTHDGEPTGGIAAFSSSKSQAWAEPMAGQDEMNHLIAETYEDNIKTTTGGIAFNGCMFMNDEYGESGEWETATWTLFGDPSLQFNDEAIPPGDAPEVEVTSPDGGEEFQAYDEVDITWETTQTDDPIDSIDLGYSTDAGDSWTDIESDLPDTGTYDWNVPNEDSAECLVRVQAVDEAGRIGDDVSSDVFEITGQPPEAPENLVIEHHGEAVQALFEDDVEDGDLGYITEVSQAEASEWDIRDHGSSAGDQSWDWGDGEFNKAEAYGGMLSSLTSPEINIPSNTDEDYGVDLTFEHWRDFGDTSQFDAGNVKLSTNGADGDFELITPEEGYDGSVPTTYSNPLGGEMAWGGSSDWTTASFDLTPYIGEDIHIRWDAGVEEWDGLEGEGWRIDEIYIEALVADEEGDDHNLITWDASPGDSDEVSHYNIYRSENQDGPWNEPIDSVDADGSNSYEYLDPDKGEADDIYWWYLVRAVGENGIEEENEDAVQEPGDELKTMDIELYTDEQTNGWNFVSFNLILEDNDLAAILDDDGNGIPDNYEKVMYYDSTNGWLSYIPDRDDDFNNLNNWDHTMGVWIRMTDDDTLTVEGTEPKNTDITLDMGWNMVSYPSAEMTEETLPTEVTTVGYFDAAQDNNIAYVEVDEFEFEPGRGYYLYAEEETNWTVEY